ncbi:lanthionine synthetase LanC family protein [Paeniglutamicibacter sp. NPDC012692]|uniref:lanthionine synthetase LanC family protein n=1 Tax=Paeniglutamicibacter sp. NPDC012692 TaxID=3364388 RepID=UPI0036BE6346
MSIVDPLVLPSDVFVEPVSGLPPETRSRLDCEDTDFVVSRPRTRTASTIVDRDMAKLLELFRSPTSITDAVVAFSTAHALDPYVILESAFGPLSALITDKLLVLAGTDAGKPVASTFQAGTVIGDIQILEVAHLLDDTEVYRGRTSGGMDVAVKIAGPAATPQIIAALRNEESVLDRLDGKIGPRLVHSGHADGRPFIATTWHSGCDLYEASASTRGLGPTEMARELVMLSERLLEAYEQLHAHGLLHGDIHPRNAIVDAFGRVTLLDFGLTVPIGSSRGFLRGGIDLFQAPEAGAAALAGKELPPLAPSAEIYSLGAILYQLFTGSPTHAFSLLRAEMNRQLANDAPRSFAEHGISNLQEIELVVLHALAKNPDDRFSSVSEMLRELRQAAARDLDNAEGGTDRLAEAARKDPPAATSMSRFEAPGQAFARGLEPPTASVFLGGAGLAYALLRTARECADSATLASADLWASKSEHEHRSDDAFWTAELGVGVEVFGRTSLFHSVTGVHCVQALVAHAQGDTMRQAASVEAFIEASLRPDHLDVLFGRAGLLLGSVFQLDTLPENETAGRLRAHTNALMDDLWRQLDRQPPIHLNKDIQLLGIAHGWAGLLYATMLWCEASNAAVPEQLPLRLQQLADQGIPTGRSIVWPRRNDGVVDNPLLAASWCNGAAGHVHLWTAAHRLFGDDRFMRRAYAAGWGAFDGPLDVVADLCCGLAGRAYALLRLYREFSDPQWLARARALMRMADSQPAVAGHRAHSLFHGDVGIALAAADVEAAGLAGMPFFEREGWHGQAQSPTEASSGIQLRR